MFIGGVQKSANVTNAESRTWATQRSPRRAIRLFFSFSVRRLKRGELDEGYATVTSSWRCGVSSRRARGRIFVRSCSPKGFRGSTAMETERVGRAGPTRLLLVPFRDGGDVVGYPPGHAGVGGVPRQRHRCARSVKRTGAVPPPKSARKFPENVFWRGVFFGRLFCTTSVFWRGVFFGRLFYTTSEGIRWVGTARLRRAGRGPRAGRIIGQFGELVIWGRRYC